MNGYTDFNDIPRGKYGLIMADCPWTFKTYSNKGKGKSAEKHYDCMTLADIARLPVKDLAGPDCVLWMWATNPMLPQAIEICEIWGFKFKTAGHWVKRTVHGKLAFGTGYCLRSSGEPFLIATRGKPKYTSKSTRSVIEGLRRDHSQKPEEGYAAAEAICADAPRLELFSRQMRAGWDVFGNEIDKFEAAHGTG